MIRRKSIMTDSIVCGYGALYVIPIAILAVAGATGTGDDPSARRQSKWPGPLLGKPGIVMQAPLWELVPPS